ncbi:MAG: glycine betaine ABC transporter substrate-binding protein [Microbacteriaceae bacterium]
MSLTVGSKDYSESLILGQIAIAVLGNAGADVTDQTGLSGSATVRSALEDGDIDLYWEYTGTAWVDYLGETESISDPDELFDAVAEADAGNGITWTSMAPANSTYGIAVLTSDAEEYGLESISDLATLLASDPSLATFCGDSEFISRDDGYVGLTEAYGLDIPDSGVTSVEGGFLYAAYAGTGDCFAGDVYSVLYGAIDALNITVLTDDLGFFPPYNPAVSTTSEYSDQIATLLDPVAALLDDETLQGLNELVDVEGEDPADVATDWLTDQGFLD